MGDAFSVPFILSWISIRRFLPLLTVSSDREWSALDFTLLGTVRSPELHLYHRRKKKHTQIIKFNINFESCNFSESKKIKCESSRDFSQLIKAHECQDTITSHRETCHLKSLTLRKIKWNRWWFASPGRLPYKGDAGALRLQILVSLRTFGTESD